MESTRRDALGALVGIAGLVPRLGSEERSSQRLQPKKPLTCGEASKHALDRGLQPAASVSFLPAGPRSVPRTIASKLGDIISVADKGNCSDDTSIQAAVDDIKASKKGGSIVFPAAVYTLTRPIIVKGDFHGGITLDGMHAGVMSSQNGAALLIGDLAEPGPEYRMHTRITNLNLTGPGKSQANSVGLAIHDSSDVFVQGGIVSNFAYALQSVGGLICDFYDLTLRDSAFGYHLTESSLAAPNSMTFYGLRSINNDRGGYTRANPNGVINFLNVEIEGNNAGGNDKDGAKVTEHDEAGSINYFGAHFESNPGQYNLYYKGSDASKNLLMAGCQVIAGAARQIHVERGRATLIASRITSNSKIGTYFGAAASGTLVDVEGDIDGTLSAVLCIRAGRLGFGINPTLGDPCINVQPGNIAAALGVAANFRGDTVQIRYQRANGTRVGYFQTSATSDHVLLNDNRAGGLGFGGHGQILFQVGRGGSNAVEPGRDNAVSNGSGVLRWSTLFCATGAIATSDANAKEQVRELSDAERATAFRCKALIRAYKFRDAVAKKRHKARWHFGVLAQDVDLAFQQEGLDARDYGLFCYDRWDAQPEGSDDDGATGRPPCAAGARYGIRYDELLAFIISAL